MKFGTLDFWSILGNLGKGLLKFKSVLKKGTLLAKNFQNRAKNRKVMSKNLNRGGYKIRKFKDFFEVYLTKK